MKIYIDTNIFYNNYFLKNANFKYLFHFIANEREELLLSKLVCEEVDNIRHRESIAEKTKILSAIKSLSKLLPEVTMFDTSKIDECEYSLLDEIENRCENVTLLEYDNILQSEVVPRALKNRKPFSDGEKGYRDTLIWLSLLHHLKNIECKEDVVFITNNSNDFFVKRKGVLSLHPELIEDLKKYNIQSKILAYDSIFSFANNYIDREQHVLEYSKLYPILENEGCNYLSGLDGSELKAISNSIGFSSIPLSNLLYSYASILEGLEDDQLEHSKELNDEEVYVTYSYNLRRVEYLIEIPLEDYLSRKSEIDAVFYDIEIKESSVLLETIMRPYFEISFIYNHNTDAYKDLDIRCVRIR